MNPSELDQKAREKIRGDSGLVRRHMEYMREMVRIDSRSFNVNEFPGDRETPTDMMEILRLAEEYLKSIGFGYVKINRPPPMPERATPILLAEIVSDPAKPTVLLYAHLDKQPYMDSEKFEKWGGIPPWELRWNADKTRAYGRGAADDLSGVVAIGMAADALLKTAGFGLEDPSGAAPTKLPCNIKVIYETEEEAGSRSLIDQIRQNRDFFAASDCVIITDVVNPAQGVPALTTSLRGIVLLEASMTAREKTARLDAQTALYKLLATLVHRDHSLAVEAIARADRPVTDRERAGYSRVPTSVEALRETAGLLPGTRLAVPPDKVSVIEAQLRKSYANARPGHRVAGSVIFGASGARLIFRLRQDADPGKLKKRLEEILEQLNDFELKLRLKPASGRDPGGDPAFAAFDLFLQSAEKDPHSGINGGPFPVSELQLARMIDCLVGDDGDPRDPSLRSFVAAAEDGKPAVATQSLWVDHDETARPFADPSAKAMAEVRLAPGNDERRALQALKEHFSENVLPGFSLELKEEKGAAPWLADLNHPAFPLMLEALEKGFAPEMTGDSAACLYGCGGSIPFVAKLMEALGDIPPLCIGAYDSDARMHEPNESLSMPDLLGCARSIVYFIAHAAKVFPKNRE